MKNYADGPEIPMGLGMALAQDITAMNYFAALSPQEQKAIIDHTHCIQSKKEMQSYVASLPHGGSAT